MRGLIEAAGRRGAVLALAIAALAGGIEAASAQSAPDAPTAEKYRGLLAAAHAGDAKSIADLIAAGADPDARDPHGRTPLMVAAHKGDLAAARLLIAAGADLNALDHDRYDVLTISGVRDDIAMVRLALGSGANPGLVTSPYEGTALIASAHLGHVEVVRALLEAGAPVDHVNNLAWTALIEAIVLGDGGTDHTTIVRDLLAAGADPNIADGQGVRPLRLARMRGFDEMARALEEAGGRE